ncbi:MAG: HI0074 family nucleotidyltransferase substrate-binding subunit [Cyclobacteriaceae bacterium]
MEDIRWKQRYDNLAKAFQRLSQAIKGFDYQRYTELRVKEENNILGDDQITDLNELDLMREGIVQRFEYTYELFINTLRDLLIYNGTPSEGVNSPRQVLQYALNAGWVDDHDGWRSMMKSRNLTSHTYDQATADLISRQIHEEYELLMNQLFEKLTDEYNQKN